MNWVRVPADKYQDRYDISNQTKHGYLSKAGQFSASLTLLTLTMCIKAIQAINLKPCPGLGGWPQTSSLLSS